MSNREKNETTVRFSIAKTNLTGGSSLLYFLTNIDTGKRFILKVPKTFFFDKKAKPSLKILTELRALLRLKNIEISIENIEVRTLKTFDAVRFTEQNDALQNIVLIKNVQLPEGVAKPKEICIVLEYLEEFSDLDQFQYSNQSEKLQILEAVQQYVNEMIEQGVATRDLKGSNFQIKRINGTIEIVFIDPGLCKIEYLDEAGKLVTAGTSTSRDIGSCITAFPPNIEGNYLDTFAHESISMQWCLCLLQFWIYFGVYPFKYEEKTILDLEKFTDLGYTELSCFILAIKKEKHTFVPLEEIIPNPNATDKELYMELVRKMEELLEKY